MSLLLAGVSHKTCPVEVRERLAARGASAALAALASEGCREAVALATCNRFEVYAPGRPEELGRLAASLDRFAGTELGSHAYRLAGEEAVRHLFSVSAGLDSLVLGESEILGQVKEAYEAAVSAGATGKLTNVLFQRAIHVGKSVRSSTTIAMGQISVASVAVELAKRIFGRLDRSAVLLLGAGDMAEKTARHLISSKVARLHIANRTEARARALAEALSGEASQISCGPWEAFPSLLSEVDIVVASTGAPEPVLRALELERALGGRRGRSLFIIDIAMPRDVAEEAGDLDGVYLYTLADLQGIVEENACRRAGEVGAARDIVAREAAEFGRWLGALSTGARFSLRVKRLEPREAAS